MTLIFNSSKALKKRRYIENTLYLDDFISLRLWAQVLHRILYEKKHR